MADLNLYETMVALMGEPTSMIGVVLLYVMTIIVVMLIGTWSVAFVLVLLRRMFR